MATDATSLVSKIAAGTTMPFAGAYADDMVPADAEAKSYGSWEAAEADFAEWASE